MKYFKENKILLQKYLFIMLFNIIIYILTSFYLKTNDIQSIIMLLIVFCFDMFIYYYKEKVKFKYYLDIITNIVVGIILLFLINDFYIYSVTLLSLFLANNIVYMKSRISDIFIIRSLQYALTFLITILCIFINLLIIFFV